MRDDDYDQEIFMPIWKIAPINDEPLVSLVQWCILETNDGSRHFVGSDQIDTTGRVSSEVVTFDRLSLRGKTQSGRIYKLIGQPGRSSNAEYVWDRWCELYGVASYVDVTTQILAGKENDSQSEEAETSTAASVVDPKVPPLQP